MTELERSRRLTVPGMVAAAARRVPHRAALVLGDERRTFGELMARTDRLASALAARGVRPGDRVAVLLHNSVEVVEAYLGCQRAGACPVPVSFRLVEDELAYIFEDCGAVGVITGGDLAERAAAAARRVPSVAWIAATGEPPAAGEPYEELLAAASPAAPDCDLDEDDVAFIMYTSGTTGRPKGARLTHQNLVFSTLSWTTEIGATAGDVWLTGQPLFHIGGVNGVLPFLFLGATSVLLPTTGFDPAHAIAELARHRVTRCVFVPTQWDDICRHPDAAALDRGVLRTAIWGASAAPRATLERMEATFPAADIVSAFGQTEMAGTTTVLKGPDSLRKLGSVGRPVLGVQIRLVDDDGRDVARGEVGELLYRGPMVMQGYHGRPDADAEAFAGGWLHSGDLLRQDDEGYLYVVDRKKDMIISGGENVYPAEVERVLAQHPAVAAVAVVGVPHPRWVETPLACVVAAGDAPAEAELLEFCRGRLAGFKKPTGVEVVAELPRNASGKVLRRVLRDRFAERFQPAALAPGRPDEVA